MECMEMSGNMSRCMEIMKRSYPGVDAKVQFKSPRPKKRRLSGLKRSLRLASSRGGGGYFKNF